MTTHQPNARVALSAARTVEATGAVRHVAAAAANEEPVVDLIGGPFDAARGQQKAVYDRAFGACMEARGYVVK